MRSFFFSCFLTVLSSTLSLCLSPEEWRSQSIYQVITDRFALSNGNTDTPCDLGLYCGGTWRGLIAKLDYIQQLGFTAVWISPVVQNIEGTTPDGDAYHGYWAQKINSVNPHFGTAEDLKSLSDALHSRGMYLMVDVVTNHMGYKGCGECVDYTSYDVFNSKDYFHPFCLITDWEDPTNAETCWEGDNIVALPDLRTDNHNVRSKWNAWIKDLVADYSIDGLRIDSCMAVEPSFFPQFIEAAGVYSMCEAFNGDPSVVGPMQSDFNFLNYPAYFWITAAFESTSGSISNLFNGLITMKYASSDTTLLGSFLENHDNPRFPSLTSDYSLAKNAVAFTLLADGIPIIYQGQEQHFSGGLVPSNREALWSSGYSTSNPMFSHIALLNSIRSWAAKHDDAFVTYKQWPIYQDSHVIATRKGTHGSQMIGVFNNFGASGKSYALTLPSTGYEVGQEIMELFTCTKVTVDSSGNLPVLMADGLPRVFYPVAALSGSGLCPKSTVASPDALKPSESCSTIVQVTFNQLVNTTMGETVKLVGSTSHFGKWNPEKAVVLSAADYTVSDPLWSVKMSLSAGTTFQYKFINVGLDGAVTWESNPSRNYIVPSGCTKAAIATYLVANITHQSISQLSLSDQSCAKSVQLNLLSFEVEEM